MSNIVTMPYDYFADPTKGRPVYNGSIYIGVVDLDPTIVANQLPIRIRQEDGTEVSVAQPVSTGAGGTIAYLGSPAQIVVDGSYSIAVLNKLGTQVYYAANVSGDAEVEDLDLRYGLVFADKTSLIATNPVSVDGLPVTLVSGMTVSTQGYTSAGDGFAMIGIIQTAGEFGITPDEHKDLTCANGTIFKFLSLLEEPVDTEQKKNYYSSNFDSITWDEIQAEGGDYHAFPMLAQNQRGRILATWMHQTQHTGSMPADVVGKYSDDAGATWSTRSVIYGTLNGPDTINPFYNTMGIDRWGRFVVVFDKYASNPGNGPALPWITRSWDGVTWSEPVQLTFSGATFDGSATIVLFGEIKLLPSGKIAQTFYQTVNDTRYVGIIDDEVSSSAVVLKAASIEVPYTASTLTFTASTDTIADSANGLANFKAGERIVVTGSGSNNTTHTVVTSSAAAITVVSGVVDEAAGASVTIDANYSEMAIGFLTETIWFGFIRQDGATNQIPYYSTVDAGTAWTWQGTMGVGLAGGWVVQTVERITINGEPHMMVSAGLRDSSTDPAGYTVSSVQWWTCPALEAIDNSGAWTRLHEISFVDDAFERDVYTSQIIDDTTGEVFVIAHEETATDESRIATSRFNYREQSKNNAFPAVTANISFNSVTVSYTDQVGRFTRIGNQVFGRIEINFTGLDNTDASGIALITSAFPYSVTNPGPCSLSVTESTGINLFTADTFYIDFNSGSTLLQLMGYNASDNAAAIAYSGLNGNGNKVISTSGALVVYVQYETA